MPDFRPLISYLSVREQEIRIRMPIRGIAIRTTSLSLLSPDASDVHLVRQESGLGLTGPILTESN